MMLTKEILDYVLTIGPYKGQTIADAIGLRIIDGVREEVRPEYMWASKGIAWMSWYLSHQCDWMNKGGIVAADRQQIAAFLINFEDCYKTEQYISWAKN